MTAKEELSDQLLAFINTTIRCLKIQIAETVEDYVDLDRVSKMHPEIGMGILENKKAIIEKNRGIFEQIEFYNRKIRLLSVLKHHLYRRNAHLILELVSDEQYLNYTEASLKKALLNAHRAEQQQ